MDDFKARYGPFPSFGKLKQTSHHKELNITNINIKGSALNFKMALPLNSSFR